MTKKTKEDTKNLADEYKAICNAYVTAFCDKHKLDYRDGLDNGWVGGGVGGVFAIGDFFVSFDDMRIDIDKDVDENEYFAYTSYALQCAELGVCSPNFANWIKGCPILSPAQFLSIRAAKKRLEDARRDFERLKEETMKSGGG